MKIAYDAKRYYHNRTGLGNYSRTLVGNMRERHGDVEAVLYDSKSLERTFRLGRKAKGEGCDLFHGLSNELPRDVVRAGVPSVVTMHDVAWRTFPDMYKPWDRLMYDWKYGWAAKNATHVVCISEATKREVMRYYDVPEERISVIYQPVQPLFYTPMDDAEADHIIKDVLGSLPAYALTVGSINSRKNLLGMVKALEQIPEGMRPLLLVVGDGREYRRKVEEYVESRGLRRWFRVESGIHDGRVLQALYTRALCMMYPSFCEGFGLPVVEASLQCCPVIASNVSSLPEAAGSDAMLVNPESAEEIANALDTMLGDSGERTRRGKAGHDYCMARYQPSVLTDQMYELYERIVEKQG